MKYLYIAVKHSLIGILAILISYQLIEKPFVVKNLINIECFNNQYLDSSNLKKLSNSIVYPYVMKLQLSKYGLILDNNIENKIIIKNGISIVDKLECKNVNNSSIIFTYKNRVEIIDLNNNLILKTYR